MNIEQGKIALENKEAVEKILTTCIKRLSVASHEIWAINITLHSTANKSKSATIGNRKKGTLRFQEITLDVPVTNTLTYILRM